MLDEHGTVVVDEADECVGARPEIDRGDLRALLLGSLPAGTVRWGRTVTGARALDDDRHEVDFADGDTTDLLIGADGAWSRIRPLLSDARPAYTGISFVEIDLLDADARHPDSAAVVGDGMLSALGDRRGFLGHRGTDGSLHVYTAVSSCEDWLDGLDFTDTTAAKAAVLEEFDGWDKRLRALVANADGTLVPRKINTPPRAPPRPHAARRRRASDVAGRCGRRPYPSPVTAQGQRPRSACQLNEAWDAASSRICEAYQ